MTTRAWNGFLNAESWASNDRGKVGLESSGECNKLSVIGSRLRFLASRNSANSICSRLRRLPEFQGKAVNMKLSATSNRQQGK